MDGYVGLGQYQRTVYGYRFRRKGEGLDVLIVTVVEEMVRVARFKNERFSGYAYATKALL